MSHVISTNVFTPRPGSEAALLALLLELQQQVRAERGAVEYAVHPASDPASQAVLVIQTFHSEAGFAEHAEHMASIGAPARLAALLDGPLARPQLFQHQQPGNQSVAPQLLPD